MRQKVTGELSILVAYSIGQATGTYSFLDADADSDFFTEMASAPALIQTLGSTTQQVCLAWPPAKRWSLRLDGHIHSEGLTLDV